MAITTTNKERPGLVGNMSQTVGQDKCKGGTVGVVKRTMEPTFGPIPPEERGTTQPPVVQRAIRRRLGLALVSGQVPFAFVNNVHLQSIFQLLGVDVLKEKHYRTEVLDELYKEVKQATMKELRELVEEGFMIVSDGWKSIFAGCGTPLVNFLVLKPDGGVLFLRVVDVSGKRKDAEAIMDLHLEVVEELRKELAVEKVTCLGFIMDNTAPNLKAMRMLQQHTPTVIAIGCSAHALNLLCKILSKHDKLQALQQQPPRTKHRAKHIDVHHHFVRERISRGEVAFHYCHTSSMLADILTKPLAAVQFNMGKQGCGVFS
ncbi:hypothetical protein QJQ45_022037 [Haematococcus lacustris]|nr:hypothetical protein QJQ45_022037 [Haematococcus lacustris]